MDRNCFTCRDGDNCELNEYMDEDQKAVNDRCDCWAYPYDYSLRECPFCGNPAIVVDDVPYEWYPNGPVKAIRCSNEFGCPGNKVRIRFAADNKSAEADARHMWNRRKRKNKITWRKAYECQEARQEENDPDAEQHAPALSQSVQPGWE